MRITPTTMPSRVHARARSSCKPLGPAWGVTSCFLVSIAMMVVVFLAQITPDGRSGRICPIPVPSSHSPPSRSSWCLIGWYVSLALSHSAPWSRGVCHGQIHRPRTRCYIRSNSIPPVSQGPISPQTSSIINSPGHNRRRYLWIQLEKLVGYQYLGVYEMRSSHQ